MVETSVAADEFLIIPLQLTVPGQQVILRIHATPVSCKFLGSGILIGNVTDTTWKYVMSSNLYKATVWIVYFIPVFISVYRAYKFELRSSSSLYRKFEELLAI